MLSMSRVLIGLLLVSPAWADGYRLGPGDTVKVDVLGHDDMSRTVQVPDSCRVELPYVPALEVCELTVAEVAETVRTKLADGVLRHPQVVVTIAEYGSQVVEIKGAVKKPGLQVLSGRTTLSQVITSAGGPSGDNVVEVTVVHADNTTETYDLNYLDTQDPVWVQAHDTVILKQGRFVHVMGEVKREGPVPYSTNITVTQAVGLAQGRTDFAGRRVRILRANGEKERVNLAQITQGRAPDVVLHPDDKVIVSRSLF